MKENFLDSKGFKILFFLLIIVIVIIVVVNTVFMTKSNKSENTLANGVAGDVTAVLAGGTTWTALENSVIHLRVFKAGAITYLFELSRE